MQMILDISDEAVQSLRSCAESLDAIIRMAAAVKLYELRRLSSGSAAQLAGVSRSVFLCRLADFNVDCFDMTEEEIKQETRFAPSHK